MADNSSLQKTLGVSFRSPALLEESLVHTSYANENRETASASNERLEFLGDAVLELVIAEKLFSDCPSSDEGDLTKLRAALVRRETLASVARRIELGNYLYLGKGEEAGGGRTKLMNLATAMEAVIGAIYLDCGWTGTKDVILKLFAAEITDAITRGIAVDYKSRLQEIIQAGKQPTPSYYVIAESGPDHEKSFTVEVRVGDTALATGSGKSKKLAETEAARQALQKIN